MILWLAANWKLLAILLLAGLLTGGGIWIGNHWSAERLLAYQEAVAKQAAAQAAQALHLTQDALRKQAGVLDAYETAKAAPDPVSAGLAERLRVVTVDRACPVLSAPAGTGRAAPAAGEPPGDGEAERVTDAAEDAFEACHRDAIRFQALINLEKASVAVPTP